MILDAMPGYHDYNLRKTVCSLHLVGYVLVRMASLWSHWDCF